MKRKTLLITISILFFSYLTNINAQSATDTIFDRSAHESFAFGADISWGGSNFKNKAGVAMDLLSILKEQGLNAVRYRVWYPANGPSGKNDVVKKAKAAHDKGFKVMIDFHYSDSWADPGKQYIPSAWEGHTTDQLVQDVYDHTYDVLKALKDVGVTPAWVQIGNETKRGMLWPNGNTNDTPGGMDNFARMINSGYDAIKAIDSTILAIVHLPDADENSLYRWMFDALKARGVKWDIIGMSAYPRWAHLDWETEIKMSIANMKDMIARYNTKVMVVETGHYWYEPYISNHFLVGLMDEMLKIGGLGCFWWEPQATMVGTYELTAWDPNTRRPTIAMDAYLGIKHNDPASFLSVSISEPLNGAIFSPDDIITLSANAANISGEISEVSFYLNGSLNKVIKEAPYSFQLATKLAPGNYSIYAKVKDSKGNEVQSETVNIKVGNVITIQENSDGYCGISNNKGTIDSNHVDYTGDGFINSDNEIGTTVNWTVNFLESGNYNLEFRYAATSTRPGTLKINGVEFGTVPFESTTSWTIWKFSSINCNVTGTGLMPISLTATNESGLPNIDYLSIKPVGHSSLPEVSSTCLDKPISSLTTLDKSTNEITVYQEHSMKSLIIKSKEIFNEISLYTISGQCVRIMNNLNNRHFAIPCDELSTGLYIIKAKVNGEFHTKKINIKNSFS